MLWLALYFPLLPLEVFTRGAPSAVPAAVHMAQGNRVVIGACNAEAQQYGIHPNMPLGGAYALCPELAVYARDRGEEQATLAQLAAWAQQFTPTVSIDLPDVLLLDIQGGWRLFGSLGKLLRKIRSGIQALGFDVHLGVAPTPLASCLLSKWGQKSIVREKSALAAALAPLPIEALRSTESEAVALRRLGLRCIGDCLNLPRAGLGRRFGPDLVAYLDRLFGHIPDPRPVFSPPPYFHSKVLLPADVEDKEALLFAMHRLLLELHGFLQARGCGVTTLDFTLRQFHAAALPFTVGLLAPSRDAAHLLKLLRERMDRLELAGAVEEISLSVHAIVPLTMENRTLFAGEAETRWGIQTLIERLQARLGQAAIQGFALKEDHRPEYSYIETQPGKSGAACVGAQRPLWLLPKLRPWNPVQHGMRLLHGPERIESGWWEGADIARDYFVAEQENGSRCWVFRDRHDRQWYVHGIFS